MFLRLTPPTTMSVRPNSLQETIAKFHKEYKDGILTQQRNEWKTFYNACSKEDAYNHIILHYNKKRESEEQKTQMSEAKELYLMVDLPSEIPACRYVFDYTKYMKTMIKQLDFNRNEEKYLQLTITKEPVLNIGQLFSIVYILANDEEDSLVMLAFPNIFRKKNKKQICEIFQVGRKFKLMNPYYKIQPDGELIIRVDHTYQYVFDDSREYSLNVSGMLAESIKLKEKANTLAKTKMIQALEVYKTSIRALLKQLPEFVLNEEDFLLEWKIEPLSRQTRDNALKHLSACFSNCSLMCMKSKEYLKALYYAKFSVWCDQIAIKPKLRLAAAMVENMQLDATRELLNELGKDYVQLEYTQVIEKILEVITMKQNQNKDNANRLREFFDRSLKLVIGQGLVNDMKLEKIEGKGYGYLATHDIKPGKIVMIDKGWSFATDDNLDISENPMLRTDPQPETGYQAIQKYLNLVLLLRQNPEYIPLFMRLYIPILDDFSEGPSPIITRYRLEYLKVLLMFYGEPNKYQFNHMNEYRIMRVIFIAAANRFSLPSNISLVFPHASYFNHSCVPNCKLYFEGDQVAVISTAYITAGEELNISYVDLDLSYLARIKECRNRGFECNCPRCLVIDGSNELEAKLSGVKCQKCYKDRAQIEPNIIRCNNCDETFAFDYTEKTNQVVSKLMELYQNAHKAINGEIINNLTKQFSDYHLVRGIALCIKARTALIDGSIEKYKSIIRLILVFTKTNPSRTVLKIINELLLLHMDSMKEDLFEEESEILDFYMLPRDVAKSLILRKPLIG